MSRLQGRRCSLIDPGFGDPRQMYAATFDDGHEVPAVPIEEIDPKYYRQVVQDPTGELPGTVVVDTSNHFLFLWPMAARRSVMASASAARALSGRGAG